MNKYSSLCRFFLLGTIAILCGTSAAFAQVHDEASMFSSAARQEADRMIATVKAQTNPSKTIVVRTVKSGGSDPQQLAEQLFREGRVNGVQIFASADPKRLIVTVGRETEVKYRGAGQVRDLMLSEFKSGNFDQGLLKGVASVSQDIVRSFSVAGATSSASRGLAAVPQSSSPTSQSSSWLLPTLIMVGIFLFLIFRRPRGAQNSTNQANPGSPGYPQQSGGWGSSILGGIGGAIAGNWLYDRFFGGSGTSHASTHNPTYGDSSHDSRGDNDYGSVGSSAGGDWGSSDSNFDSGGGDFGGGDSGGGDW